jgi:NAD(P)-dependent dehydrogenase (short-subunit alcohol dehydrogenase family)
MKTADRHGRSVLITGSSSGIGRATAVHLARKGFTVFATVRKEADAEKLRGLGVAGLVPLYPLDLAKPEQIPAINEAVERELEARGQEGLFALVNNAGGGSVAPIELMDPGRFRTELEARIAGPVTLVQALLPRLRRGGGRIVWIMTPAIIPTPYVASIHACDFAVNGLARTLEIELKPWAIPSIMIRCGGIRTEAVSKSDAEFETDLKSWRPEKRALYEPALRRWSESMASFNAKRTDPEKVAAVVEKALSSAKPKRRYSIGHMARAAAFLEALPQGLADHILKARF